jgi:hypothetical protein
MHFLAHAITQRCIDHLMPRNQPLAFKRGAHNRRLKMTAIAFNFQVLACEPSGDVLLDLLRCWVTHVSCP